MNDLMVFDYQEIPVRTIQNETGVWWVLADVCRVLDVKNVTQVAQRLDPDERAMFDIGLKNGNANCINEPGLYSVILRSDKPEAKAFKRWVTHEVLPAIRKNGSYGKKDEKLEVAKLLAACKDASAVKAICTLYQIEIASMPILTPVDSVSRWLSMNPDLNGMPSKTAYQSYRKWCASEQLYSIPLSSFSKKVHTVSGMVVKRHRINGKQIGFYENAIHSGVDY